MLHSDIILLPSVQKQIQYDESFKDCRLPTMRTLIIVGGRIIVVGGKNHKI